MAVGLPQLGQLTSAASVLTGMGNRQVPHSV
jgi:hypothetical protein